MESEILVSVILPVYNAEKYLDKCLNSLCNQTLKEIEIIAVNDGSSDDSLNILKSFARKDSRITIFDIPNGGVSKARNLGIDHASGQYLTFVDSDDWIDKTMLKELYDACIFTKTNIAKCDLFWQTASGSRKLDYTSQSYRLYNHVECLKLLFTEIGEKHYGFVSSKLYLKSFVDEHDLRFDEDMNFAEDTLFITRAVIKNKTICYIPKQMYYYNVVNEGSLTRGVTNLREKYDVLYERLKKVLKDGNVYEEVKNSFLNYQFEGLLIIMHNVRPNHKNRLLDDFKKEIKLFVKKYPDITTVDLINRRLAQKIFVKLIYIGWIELPSLLIYFNLKKNKVI